MATPTTRTAIVYSDNPGIANYLPHRYHVVKVEDGKTYIEGEDFCGWTLDGYVIPRLCSGMFRTVEITCGACTVAIGAHTFDINCARDWEG